MDFENLNADVNKILTKHFTKGRGGNKIQFVVIHYNYGDLTVEGCYNVWQTREASAHYQVESSGRIGQLVWDDDTAWHAGNFSANQKSIGIEHANQGNSMTDACIENGAHLCAAVCKYYGLGRPEWMVNVFPHCHFIATNCPGPLREGTSYHDKYMKRAQYWYDVMTGAPNKSPDGDKNPQKPGNPVNDSGFLYRAHIADYGWLDSVRDGQTAGTTGKGKQLEAIKITPPDGLKLDVKIHIQNKGWQTWHGIEKGVSSGEGSSVNDPIIGTVGESLRIEALEVNVVSNTTGKNLKYRVHIADHGWTDWVDHEYTAGTVGISKAIEAVQFVLE
jgi:hypothetical protein